MKERKQKNNMGVVGAEDRISELSDPVLHHILSFLLMKCVVSTSILSKRWRYLWKSVQVLDFREWHPNKCKRKEYRSKVERFTNCVDKMLSFHDDMPKIKKLCLNIDDKFDESRVNGWISNVTRREVEEIIIEFHVNVDSFTLSPYLFTCESLTMMELDMTAYLELPGSIYLPRLKIICLSSMVFSDDNSTQQLFSNCPVLEELMLKNCQLDCLNAVSILAPALKYLSIDGPSDNLDYCTMKIYAPSLLSLEYREHVPKDYDLHSFPSLVDADVDFSFEKSSPEASDVGSQLIGALFNVKLLKMSSKTFEALSFGDDPLITLPTFCNLIHLEMSSKFLCSTNQVFFDFLQILPKLESLIFTEGIERSISDNDDSCLSDSDDSWTPDLISQGSLVHLKSVEFWQFYGHTRELNVVKLFLKHVKILERMTVICSLTLSTDMKKVIKELLQLYPRHSTSCVIKVA